MKWLVWMAPITVLACAHQQANVQNPAEASPRPETAAAPPPSTAAAPAEHACSQDGDCGARQLCIRSRCVDVTNDVAECQNARVHFAFDRAELEPQELPILQRVSRCLTAVQALHVIIEGNADERGTEEYNLTLGDRRANAVEKYLERLGVPTAQLQTVSYGKEKPLCTEHDEACWAKNRRAALKRVGDSTPDLAK